MKYHRDTPVDSGDPLIPILNLVCMLIPLLLYGAVFVKFKVLDVQPPRITHIRGEVNDEKSLKLRVIVAKEGFYIKVDPRYRKAWMADANSGPDIPKTDNGFDFAELHKKLSELKSEHMKEQTIHIGAEDDIEYEILIKTMDYTRGTAKKPLFPNVQLTRSLV
ncbi:MAG: biopolymer transporter ExbD [Deltaproteobacteria bacterium]|nr:biopolymer transporter ExbD [Deltaproteobacteria bacterium]